MAVLCNEFIISMFESILSQSQFSFKFSRYAYQFLVCSHWTKRPTHGGDRQKTMLGSCTAVSESLKVGSGWNHSYNKGPTVSKDADLHMNTVGRKDIGISLLTIVTSITGFRHTPVEMKLTAIEVSCQHGIRNKQTFSCWNWRAKGLY